jgi:hypothetical protein
MKKLTLLLASALMVFVFSSCDKATDNSETLPNSEWETKIGDETIVLNFINESACTFSSSINGLLRTYGYRLRDAVDSRSGYFAIYQIDKDMHWGEEIYSGFIENKKIILQPTAEWITKYPSFQRRNEKKG